MDQPKEKPKKYDDTLFVNPQNVGYGHESYVGFDVRIVYYSGKLKGEYHIKPADDVEMGNILPKLKEQVGQESDVNLVDRSGVLNLDWPIYVIVKDPMLFDAMEEVWKALEKELSQ